MASNWQRFTRTGGKGECTFQAGLFAPEGGAREAHICLMPPRGGETFAQQLAALEEAYGQALEQMGLIRETALLRRFFLSDTANQEELLTASPLAGEATPMAISLVEQPPLPEGRLAMWAWHLEEQAGTTGRESLPGGVLAHRGEDRHLLLTDIAGAGASPREQTRQTLNRLQEVLAGLGANLRDQVIRTWVFVPWVDSNYGQMVEERVDLFRQAGLTGETNYIASTGIEGRRADSDRLVLLEAYAMPDIKPERLRYLTAPEQLGPTDAYGVTFERGVEVMYGDRRHLVISGTASIDNRGRILHPGDIRGQTERTFANIAGLLADGGAGPEDIGQMIVYLRDPADRIPVEDYLDRHQPTVPRVMVRAPVCRPGWLIEVECWAVTAAGNRAYPPL